MSSQVLCLCVEIELLLHSLLNKWKILCSFIFLGFLFILRCSQFSSQKRLRAAIHLVASDSTLLSTLASSSYSLESDS